MITDKNNYRLLGSVKQVSDKNDVAMDISFPPEIVLNQDVKGGNIYGDVVDVPAGTMCQFDQAINDDGIALGVYRCGDYNILVTKDETNNGYLFTIKDANSCKDKSGQAFFGYYESVEDKINVLDSHTAEEVCKEVSSVCGDMVADQIANELLDSSYESNANAIKMALPILESLNEFEFIEHLQDKYFLIDSNSEIDKNNVACDKNDYTDLEKAVYEYLEKTPHIELIGDSFKTEEFFDFIAEKTVSFFTSYTLSDLETVLDKLTAEGYLRKEYVPSGVIYDKNSVKDKNETVNSITILKPFSASFNTGKLIIEDTGTDFKPNETYYLKSVSGGNAYGEGPFYVYENSENGIELTKKELSMLQSKGYIDANSDISSEGTSGNNPEANPFKSVTEAIDGSANKVEAYKAVIEKLISDPSISDEEKAVIITMS